MNQDKIENVLKKGSEIAGSAVGGAIGFLFAGPLGAAGGAAAGTALTQLLDDVTSRMLSEKESKRIGGAAAIAINDVKTRIENGELPRDDIWHDSQEPSSDAEDMLEGVLLKARDENEIKKIPHISKIFSNAVFDSRESIHQVNLLLKIGQSLTYQQMGIIAIAANTEAHKLTKESLKAGQSISYEILTAYTEAVDLFKKDILLLQQPGKPNHSFVFELQQIVPANMQLSTFGKYLYEKMSLNEYQLEDLKAISEKFS